MRDMKVLKKDGIEIGAFKVPRHKKPMIGVMSETDCRVVCYGSFQSEEAADAFMTLLADFVGAEELEEIDESDRCFEKRIDVKNES